MTGTLPEEAPSEDSAYADLGGIRTEIPPSLRPILSHIAEHHSAELDLAGREIMGSLDPSLRGTRLGDGLSTIAAIVGLAEEHLKPGDIVTADVEEVRRELFDTVFGLLRGLAAESRT